MAARTATMSEVAATLMGRVDEIATAMVSGYRERIPEYTALLEVTQEDVHAVSRGSAQVFLTLVIEDRDVSAEEMAMLRLGARRRAAFGFPINALLQAYSIGRELAWGFISGAGSEAGVAEEDFYLTALRMTRFIEALTLAVTQEYLEHITTAYEEEQRRLSALVDLVKAINRSLDLDDVITVGLERSRHALAVEWAAIWLVDFEKGTLILQQQLLVDQWAGRPGATGELLEIKLGSPGLGQAAVNGFEMIITGDAIPELARRSGCRLVALVPMLHRERPVGMLGVATTRRAELSKKEHGFLVAVADQLAVAVSQVQEHIREARTDFLTGLANRQEFDRFLRHELSRAERFDTPLALALVDVDRLKQINDSQGHQAGDEALSRIAATLKSTVRSLDLAARIGGDEFAVVMPQTGEEGAADVVERLEEGVAQIELESGVKVSISIGLIGWRRGQSADEFIGAADRHLYEDKQVAPERG